MTDCESLRSTSFQACRVSGVCSQSGEALSFIQEDKSEDANYFVVLPKAVSAGEKFTLTTNYNGRDAVTNEGEGNYFPVARHDWYPNTANAALGSFATYDMTFRIPAKGLTMAASQGAQVSDTTVGSQDVSVWKSEMPQTVAGFNSRCVRKLQEAQMTNLSYYVVWHLGQLVSVRRDEATAEQNSPLPRRLVQSTPIRSAI